MKKIIKKYGNAHVIVLYEEERKVYGLEEGDVIELTITKTKRGIE